MPKTDKTRDSRRMPRFHCNGWLHIVAGRDIATMDITVKHEVEHVAYKDIYLPDKWKEYIRDNARNQTPGQVSRHSEKMKWVITHSCTKIWRHIVREELRNRTLRKIKLGFSSKAVYYHWLVVSREEWKLDDDPIKSARKFILERGEEHGIAPLDVPAEPGTEVLAFQVTDFVEEWAKNTQELAMDSTCE